jgi:hypothetical protein
MGLKPPLIRTFIKMREKVLNVEVEKVYGLLSSSSYVLQSKKVVERERELYKEF